MATVALRRRASLRGIGALTNSQCYASTSCRATMDAVCYTTGYFTDACLAWRAYEPGSADILTPPLPITTSGPAPTAEDIAAKTPDQLLTDQARAGAAQNLQNNVEQIGVVANTLCVQLKESCGMFTSPNAECTDCSFDPSRPAFLLLVFAAAALLIAKPWK